VLCASLRFRNPDAASGRHKRLVAATKYFVDILPNGLVVATKLFGCGIPLGCGNQMIWLWQPNCLVVAVTLFGYDNEIVWL